MDNYFPVDNLLKYSSSMIASQKKLTNNNIKEEFLLMLCQEMLKDSFKMTDYSDPRFRSSTNQDLAVKIAAKKLAEQLSNSGAFKNYDFTRGVLK